MTLRRDELIRSLARDLAPVRSVAPARRTAAAFLGSALLFVVGATLASGPLRPGALAQLVAEPAFALEAALALAASALAALAAMRLRIPGGASGLSRARPALALALGWAVLLGIERLAGSGPASSLGGRVLCWVQVLVFSLPPLALGLWLARRAAPLEPAWTGALAGLAAGSLAAFAMELGCMHEPLHGLLAHLAPGLAMAAAGALLGARLLPRV